MALPSDALRLALAFSGNAAAAKMVADAENAINQLRMISPMSAEEACAWLAAVASEAERSRRAFGFHLDTFIIGVAGGLPLIIALRHIREAIRAETRPSPHG